MQHQEHAYKTARSPRKRPMDVVESAGIPVSEKLSILKAWEADDRALQRAEDEGMGGGEHAHLQRVQEALAKLPSQLRISLRLLAVGLGSIRDGVWEGFGAYREYENLIAKGIPHDTALRQAFCVSSD